ncbi:MAG: CpXC domain-containing protein [Candidatus Deferrimicrobiaceae bacterium]
MALKATYEIRCSCGETFTGDIYEYVFAEHDPELKDSILSGEFNRVSCPACGRGLPIENRFLYREEKNKLWIWVCGKEEESRREELAEELIEKSAVIEGHFLDDEEDYRKFLVFGREGLIGLLLKEDQALKRREGRILKKNPALRWIREGNEDPGYLFLRGEKIRIALPLRLPEARKGRFAASAERRRWLESYSQGVNIHNQCSSFLNERARLKWNGIREKEPFPGTGNEFDDFAESWAGYRTEIRRFSARYPKRSAFFDELRKKEIARKVRSINPRRIPREPN